ncbi:MAG: GxxExxY protein [Kiritimatiellia bacterium]
MTEQKANAICDKIRQVAYDLHVYLGVGYLEKVYETGLIHRLAKAGMTVEAQVPIQVTDEDGFVLGEYVADLVVDGIVIELKTVSTLLPVHTAQLINYLKAMKREHGLLINFGSEKFQCKKVARRL